MTHFFCAHSTSVIMYRDLCAILSNNVEQDAYFVRTCIDGVIDELVQPGTNIVIGDERVLDILSQRKGNCFRDLRRNQAATHPHPLLEGPPQYGRSPSPRASRGQ